MKKIFTLIICVVALCPMAKADNNALIDRCINFILNAGAPSTTIMATNLDANHDGAVNITDVTTLVNNEQNGNQARPMRGKKSSVNELIQTTLKTKESSPSIKDVTKAINEEKNKEE